MTVSDEHHEKALYPIFVTLDGMYADVRETQSPNGIYTVRNRDRFKRSTIAECFFADFSYWAGNNDRFKFRTIAEGIFFDACQVPGDIYLRKGAAAECIVT